ncbi:MAG: hypothetical protein K6F34_01285 [Lachnospiraceae bacterium]|nr:hypothetical protein [Lachnospiraceae bacterium]
MENKVKKFDAGNIIAIVIGTVIIISINAWSDMGGPIKGLWVIQACSAFVVVISAIYGMAAGLLMPIAACLIYGVVMNEPILINEAVFLSIGGMITGHYSDRFMVNSGEFNGMRLIDYAVIETIIAIITWVCLYPLVNLYFNDADLGFSLLDGVKYCGMCIFAKIFLCLPVLLLFNMFFKKKRMVDDARKEYLYERK